MTDKKPTENTVTIQPRAGAMAALAERFGVEPTAMFVTSLRKVAFKSPDVTDEQLMALVLVANQYKLNPFTRELYAFPEKGGGIVPIVSVDGWFRIINEHSQFDGLSYSEVSDNAGALEAGEVTIYRKDRSHPLVIREALVEVRRSTDPWKQNPRRMLRHKTIIQGARIAFGFAGIYEPDEGERIIQSERAVRIADAVSSADKIAKLLDVPRGTVPSLPEEPGQAPQAAAEVQP